MALLNRFFLQCMVSLILCSYSLAAGDDSGSADPCPTDGAVRLDAVKTNATLSTVEGRVQICEGGEWRHICDSMWTLQDAEVTCRALNYSSRGKRMDWGYMA